MAYVPRTLASQLKQAARSNPVVTVTGPRQSGKTTLCRAVFPELHYVSLEPLDTRTFALEDPRGFLATYGSGAVIDEIQHASALCSYIQESVDELPTPGRFVLTGSQHLSLVAAIAQSLAGRSAMLVLLPLSLEELLGFENAPRTLNETLWQGAYPRIADRGLSAARWLADYTTTYLERDVRQVRDVGDLLSFGALLRLCAGRTAQLENLSALGSDAGVSHNTARAWTSVLEATYLVARLPSWHRNTRKRLVKSPKLHFLDSGLVCQLLGIEEHRQLVSHPLRGPVFESWVAAEVLKARYHRGKAPNLYHYREDRGAEVDLVLETADRLLLVEAKSGSTIASDWLTPLLRFRDRLVAAGESRAVELRIVYGGDTSRDQKGVAIVPWFQIHEHDW